MNTSFYNTKMHFVKHNWYKLMNSIKNIVYFALEFSYRFYNELQLILRKKNISNKTLNVKEKK